MEAKELIGKNIAFLRGIMGLTQEDIAVYLGVNRVEISYYETGQRVTPTDKLDKLAELFGIHITDFYSEQIANSDIQHVIFAFRSAGLKAEDLEGIADFRRIVNKYLRMKELEKKLK